jgi:hypothetical protein
MAGYLRYGVWDHLHASCFTTFCYRLVTVASIYGFHHRYSVHIGDNCDPLRKIDSGY